MIKNICAMVVTLAASVLLAGCQFQNKTTSLLPTAPSSTGSSNNPSPSTQPSGSSGTTASGATTPAAAGTWASPTIAGLPNISSCSDLQWQISNLSATSLAGSVSALCGGVVNVTANLTGEMSGSDILNLTANGQAVGLGITCPFSVVGVGHMQGSDAMRLDYQGMTCLGPVSGSEMLHRRAPAAPAPTPTAPPEPEPQPAPQPAPDDGAYGCSSIGDHMKLVECVHGHVNPHNEFEAFEVTKRVAWALRGESVGLLIKTTGENIVPWKGYIFAAGRICYPDGHIIKIISDVGPGGANGPIWLDNGFVDSKFYLPALDPTN